MDTCGHADNNADVVNNLFMYTVDVNGDRVVVIVGPTTAVIVTRVKDARSSNGINKVVDGFGLERGMVCAGNGDSVGAAVPLHLSSTGDRHPVVRA